MNKIHIESSWSPSRVLGSPITWVLVTGAIAWATGYAARGAGGQPAAQQAACVSSGSASGLTAAVREQQHSELMAMARSNDAQAVATKIGILKRAVLDFDPRQQPLDDYNQLVVLAREDRSFRQEIMERYEKATDPHLKSRLATLLTHVGTPDMKDFAEKLINSGDGVKRGEGFRIMATLDSTRADADQRQRLISALDKETNPAALQSLITGMSPGETRPPQEVAAIVGRLSELSRHPDITVRTAALSSIARWGEADKIEGIVTEALADPNPEVATAAIYASAEAGLKTPAVRNMLFQLAGQQNATIDFRRAAATVLSNFNLSSPEFDRLTQLRKELGARDA